MKKGKQKKTNASPYSGIFCFLQMSDERFLLPDVWQCVATPIAASIALSRRIAIPPHRDILRIIDFSQEHITPCPQNRP